MEKVVTHGSFGLSTAGAAAVVAVIVVAAVAVVAFASLGASQTGPNTLGTSFGISATLSTSESGTGTAHQSSTTSTNSQSTTSGGSASPVRIVIPSGIGTDQSLNFEPAVITVVIGVNNTIVWTDQDSSAAHTVTALTVPAGAQKFDSGTSNPLNSGSTFSVTLTVPGTYSYHCVFHPAWMKGTIVVKQG